MILKTNKIIRVLVCILLVQCSLFAESLSEYRGKIQNLSEQAEYLNYPEDYLTDAQNIASEREIIKEIRSQLPLKEKIEMTGTSMEVDHSAYLELLKKFESESFGSEKRKPIINELVERFAALESKLGELENQTLSNRSKDEEKQKLDEILKRAEFQKPAPPEETWFQRKWREFKEWLASLMPEPKPKEAKEPSGGSAILANVLLYIIIAAALALLGFVLFRFAPFFLKKFKERERSERKSRVILGETIAADDDSQGIFAEAEQLAREGNLRGAIRKGYIAVLCELSDRKIIGLARHKTNRDYLRDLKSRRELHQNMNSLTLNFERNWYGGKAAEAADWEEFKQTYQETLNKT